MLAIIFLAFIIVLIGYFTTTGLSLYAGLVLVMVLLVGYYLKNNHKNRHYLSNCRTKNSVWRANATYRCRV
jgi:L-asparagine transporter-like permease